MLPCENRLLSTLSPLSVLSDTCVQSVERKGRDRLGNKPTWFYGLGTGWWKRIVCGRIVEGLKRTSTRFTLKQRCSLYYMYAYHIKMTLTVKTILRKTRCRNRSVYIIEFIPKEFVNCPENKMMDTQPPCKRYLRVSWPSHVHACLGSYQHSNCFSKDSLKPGELLFSLIRP